MHLLLRKRGLPPTEIANDFSTVRKGFPGPEPYHPGQRGWVPWSPVHGAWLLFHHPPSAAADRAIALRPEVPDVQVAQAWIRYIDGDLDDALQRVREGLSNEPAWIKQHVGHGDVAKLSIVKLQGVERQKFTKVAS